MSKRENLKALLVDAVKDRDALWNDQTGEWWRQFDVRWTKRHKPSCESLIEVAPAELKQRLSEAVGDVESRVEMYIRTSLRQMRVPGDGTRIREGLAELTNALVTLDGRSDWPVVQQRPDERQMAVAAPPVPAAQPAPVEDRFRNWTKLGAGAFGDVWRADDIKLGRPVALKIVRTSAPPSEDALAHARALVRVPHPNIVTVYDVAEVLDPVTREPAVAVVMELVEGPTLAERFRGRAFDLNEVERIGATLLDVVAEFHAREVAHTDLHDENVILGARQAKVLDPRYFDTAFARSTASREYRQGRDLRDLRHLLVKILRHSPVALEAVHQCEQATDPPTIDGLRTAYLAAVHGEPSAAPASEEGDAALIELLRQKGPRGAYRLVHLAMEVGRKPSEIRAALLKLEQKGVIRINVLNGNEVVYRLVERPEEPAVDDGELRETQARLRGLAVVVGKHLEDKRARYLDPASVLDLFARFGSIRDQLVGQKVFADLPVRETPTSSGTTDHDGRGYIERRFLEDLLHDLDYCLKVLETLPP